MPGISDLLESDVEEHNFIDENSIISSASDATDVATNTANTKTKRGKKRHRVTMPKVKSKVAKSSPAPTARKTSSKTAAAKRNAVQDAIEPIMVADSQGVTQSGDESMAEVEDVPKPKRKPAGRKATKSTKRAVEQLAAVDAEIDQTPMMARSSHARSTTAKAAPKVIKANNTASKSKAEHEIAAEQHTADAGDTVEPEELDELVDQQPPTKRVRTESRTRQEPLYRRRAGSASDTERGDPNLRRKLGDVTRKFENIDIKYKTLKEVGITEANANVEKLRRQCEATTEASNNLISSLKKELTQQAPLIQDARKLKKDLQIREEEMVKLHTAHSELTASLVGAQNEIKALQAKLAAARAASINIESAPSKIPGSAIKVGRSAAVANSEAVYAAQVAQMKLDLYGDLTGLIVRSAKRAEDGDTFDCIQTGRNGTLHFKLFIDQEDAKSSSFEETEFLYTPLLDTNRDHDMMEFMPPYLTEDITFARQNAAKFYQRVVDTLTRRNCDG